MEIVLRSSSSSKRRLLPSVRPLLCVAGLSLLGAAPSLAIDCAQVVRVIDAQSQPVPNAVVSQVGGESAATDEQGEVCWSESWQGTVLVSADGWAAATANITASAAALTVELVPAFGEELVVSATGSAQRLKDLPVHIEAIGRDEIFASAARTLAEAVEYTPGLRIESNCANCNTSQLRLLGLEGPYSQIVVDGQPTVSSLALVYGLEQIPARMLDGIEVLKGSGSAIYGASSIAGTVNLLPHQADHPHIDLELESNSIEGSQSGRGGAARALFDWGTGDGRRSASLYGQRDDVPAVDVDGDGFSEVTDRQLTAFGSRGSLLVLGDSGQLVGDANWTDAERRGGDLVNFDRPPDETLLTEAISTETRAASVRWLHRTSAATDYRLALSWVDIERDSYYGAGFDPNAFGLSEGTTYVLSAQVDHGHDRGTISAGVQADRDELFDEQLGYSRITEQLNESWSLYAQEDRKIGRRMSLLYGARLDDHSAISGQIVSPRAALLFSPRSDLTLRAAYGHGFRPPAVFDEDLHIELVGGGVARVVRPSPDLVEESSRSALLSAEWRPTLGRRGSGAFELALFDTRLDDLFFNREVDDPRTPELELLRVNLDGADVRGMEASATLRFGSVLQVDAGFVAQRARFDSPEPDFGSRNFWRTPESYGNASVRWSATSRIQVFAGALYTGSMDAPHFAGFIAEDRLERTSPFLTFDLNARWSVPLGGERELSIVMGAKNLTNDYQEDLDRGPERDSSYVYGPRFPRQWFLSTGLRF